MAMATLQTCFRCDEVSIDDKVILSEANYRFHITHIYRGILDLDYKIFVSSLLTTIISKQIWTAHQLARGSGTQSSPGPHPVLEGPPQGSLGTIQMGVTGSLGSITQMYLESQLKD